MNKKTFQAAMIIPVLIFVCIPLGICETFKYESKGRRDPLVPLVGKEISSVANLMTISSIEDLKLEGIAIGAKGKNVAIMNGEMVREGDRFGELAIKKITKKSVIVSITGAEHTVELPEEGGTQIEK
ncbi:MAG: hypothetical protein WC779_05525 [Candidatus Omnitrophota bacterium]|jgi:hypothetical protein